MPELPEVERVRSELAAQLVAAGPLRIKGVHVARRDVVVMPGDPSAGFSRQRSQPGTPGPQPKRLAPGLLGRGAVIRAVDRHGKSLGVLTDRAVIGIHLGMTGSVHVLAAGERLAGDRLTGERHTHAHVVWSLVHDSGERRGRPAGRMVFRDPRRFGGVWGFAEHADLVAHRARSMGPDALDPDHGATRAWFTQRLRSTRRCLKAALLDQRLIAGVGNIYADEALHRSRLSPGRLGTSVSTDDARRLFEAIQRVLRDAIARGGSTIRDYRGSSGEPGTAQHSHAVYGRAGQACLSCGTPLAGDVLAGRATVWCTTCQR